MSKALAKRQVNPLNIARATKMPWGRANARRGLVKDENPEKYFELAEKFAAQYPIESSLTVDEFDTFLAAEKIMAPAPSRDSPRWLAHIRDRKSHREGLQGAARHPRMRDYQIEPFEMVWPHGSADKRIRVESLVKSTIRKPKEFEAWVKGWAKRVKHLTQGFDQFSHSPEQLALLDNCNELYNNVAEDAERALARAHERARRTLALLNTAKILPPQQSSEQ
jgi:hypothetical protein